VTTRSIRVGIVAQALTVRLGLRAMLQGLESISIAAESPRMSGLELIDQPLDVVVLMGDAEAVGFPVDLDQTPTVLWLCDTPPAESAWLEQAGAWGMLPIDCTPDELEAAIVALSQGLWVSSPALRRQLMSMQPVKLLGAVAGEETLTGRELEVLGGLSQGLANKQISLALGISENTVKYHVSAIYAKLGATNRTEAVRIGVQKGLITL
jgi:DNA-binding NarL/FixJ family response regulator